jgi:chromosome segregation ATPase
MGDAAKVLTGLRKLLQQKREEFEAIKLVLDASADFSSLTLDRNRLKGEIEQLNRAKLEAGEAYEEYKRKLDQAKDMDRKSMLKEHELSLQRSKEEYKRKIESMAEQLDRARESKEKTAAELATLRGEVSIENRAFESKRREHEQELASAKKKLDAVNRQVKEAEELRDKLKGV